MPFALCGAFSCFHLLVQLFALSIVECAKAIERAKCFCFASQAIEDAGRRIFYFYMEVININMAWVMLGIAGIFEVVWATCMKYSEGFTKLSWSLLTFAGMAVSFYLLARATKTLPLGTAYAVWTGIGALGSVIVGIILFKEPVTAGRLIFAALLLVGIIGLKITSA